MHRPARPRKRSVRNFSPLVLALVATGLVLLLSQRWPLVLDAFALFLAVRPELTTRDDDDRDQPDDDEPDD